MSLREKDAMECPIVRGLVDECPCDCFWALVCRDWKGGFPKDYHIEDGKAASGREYYGLSREDIVK